MSLYEQTYILEKIAVGVIPGATALYMQGYNAAPTTTFETVWDNSNAYTFLAVNMTTPTIVSSSANDTAAGTGARTVRITGVNASYVAQTENVTLNGATPVSLVNSYMMINSITVLTAGSGGVTAGNLTLAAGGTTHGFVLAGRNQSTSYMFCTSSQQGLLIHDLYLAEEAASVGGGRAQIIYSTNLGLTKSAGIWSQPTNLPLVLAPDIPLYFPPKTQIQLQYLAAAATAVVSAFSTATILNLDKSSTGPAFATWI